LTEAAQAQGVCAKRQLSTPASQRQPDQLSTKPGGYRKTAPFNAKLSKKGIRKPGFIETLSETAGDDLKFIPET
jgi:hypothetical protein